MKRAEVVGLGLLVVIGGVVGYEVYRTNAAGAPATPTTSGGSSSATNWTRSGYTYSGWSAPSQYTLASSNYSVVGPGSGNQPNGLYYLATTLTVPQTGTVTFSAYADDSAAIYVGGGLQAQISLSQGLQQFGGTIQAGTYIVAVQTSNNDDAGFNYVPQGSGSANPTGFYMAVTQNGQTLLSTASATGWLMLAYPSTALSPNAMPAYGSTSTTTVASSVTPNSTNPYVAPTNCPSGTTAMVVQGAWQCVPFSQVAAVQAAAAQAASASSTVLPNQTSSSTGASASTATAQLAAQETALQNSINTATSQLSSLNAMKSNLTSTLSGLNSTITTLTAQRNTLQATYAPLQAAGY